MCFTKWLAMGAACFAAYTASVTGAAVIVHQDEAAFNQSVFTYGVEDFESATPNQTVTDLTFGARSGSLTVDYANQDRVSAVDWYGAVAHSGDQYYIASAASIVFAWETPVTAFGFYFSDLEWVDLSITVDDNALPIATLSEPNSNINDFFGFTSDASFGSVRVTWSSSRNDGVGFDDVRLGDTIAATTTAFNPVQIGGTTIPEPGSLALLMLGSLLIFARPGQAAGRLCLARAAA